MKKLIKSDICSCGIRRDTEYDLFNYYNCYKCYTYLPYFDFDKKESIINSDEGDLQLFRISFLCYKDANIFLSMWIDYLISEGVKEKDIIDYWYCNNNLCVILTNVKLINPNEDFIMKELNLIINKKHKTKSYNPMPIQPFIYKKKVIMPPNIPIELYNVYPKFCLLSSLKTYFYDILNNRN